MQTNKKNKNKNASKVLIIKGKAVRGPNQKKQKPKVSNVASGTAIAVKEKLIPNVSDLVPAQGILTDIQIEVTADQDALHSAPIGLVTLALSRGAQNPYAVYQLLYADFVNLINGGTGLAPSRLEYMNSIYNAFTPKNIKVPFRDGTVSYRFTPLSTLPPGSAFTIRGKSFYMYNPSNILSGPWYMQDPPAPYSETEIQAAYNTALTAISGKQKHNLYTRNVGLTSSYANDASAYARNSPYYGSGSGVGSPFGSAESEVPFKSSLLSVLTQFDSSISRASRKLRITSGDSTSNIAIGTLKEFHTSLYNGPVPPIYKFLDLNELAYLMARTLVTALEAMTSTPTNVVLADDLNGGLPFSYGQFLLILRQQILAMFADSQALGQFMIPDSNGAGLFESFRCGSNCYPKQPATKFLVTQMLNENLKGLKMAVRGYSTKKYQNDNNKVIHIPVWGAFKSWVPTSFIYRNANGDPIPLFAPETGNDPDLWDGSFNNGGAADLNDSPIANDVVQEWNYFMTGCTQTLNSMEQIGGDGCGSPFLQFTRYVKFKSQDFRVEVNDRQIARVPKHCQQFIVDKTEEIVTPGTDKRSSKKEMRNFKVYAPPIASVYTEYTQAITGFIPITATHREFLSIFILPIIEVEIGDNLPTTSEIQISSLEPYKLQVFAAGRDDLNATVFGSRAAELDSRMPDEVKALAGEKSGLSSFVEKVSDADEGGFLGDLFATAGTIARGFGAGGIGDALAGAGSVANLIGI